MSWKGKVPFTKSGDQLHYADYPCGWYSKDGDPEVWEAVRWESAFEFEASLRIEGMRSGRSAKHITLRDVKTERQYILFVTDLVDLAGRAVIDRGVITGRWGFCKRGLNFGVQLIGDANN